MKINSKPSLNGRIIQATGDKDEEDILEVLTILNNPNYDCILNHKDGATIEGYITNKNGLCGSTENEELKALVNYLDMSEQSAYATHGRIALEVERNDGNKVEILSSLINIEQNKIFLLGELALEGIKGTNITNGKAVRLELHIPKKDREAYEKTGENREEKRVYKVKINHNKYEIKDMGCEYKVTIDITTDNPIKPAGYRGILRQAKEIEATTFLVLGHKMSKMKVYIDEEGQSEEQIGTITYLNNESRQLGMESATTIDHFITAIKDGNTQYIGLNSITRMYNRMVRDHEQDDLGIGIDRIITEITYLANEDTKIESKIDKNNIVEYWAEVLKAVSEMMHTEGGSGHLITDGDIKIIGKIRNEAMGVSRKDSIGTTERQLKDIYNNLYSILYYIILIDNEKAIQFIK